jgi:hypothetical protein
VVLLGGYIYLYYYAMAKSFTEQQDELLRELEIAANRNTQEVTAELRKLVDNTSPTVSKAVADQFKKDLPKFMTLLGTERENLAVNIRSRLESQLQSHYRKSVEQHFAILREEFPTVRDERDLEIMADNFTDALNPLIKRHYGDRIAAEFHRMYEVWDRFEKDESKRSRDELADALYHHLLQLMQDKVVRMSEAEQSSATPEASRF